MKRIKLIVLVLLMVMSIFNTSAMANTLTVDNSTQSPIFTVAAVAIVIIGVAGYFIKNKIK